MADKSNSLNKGEKTRILLLDTAERLFGQNGVTATSWLTLLVVAMSCAVPQAGSNSHSSWRFKLGTSA